MLVDDIGADGDVHGDRDVELRGGGEDGETRDSGNLARRAASPSARPGAEAARHAVGKRGVHAASGLIDHAEGAVIESALHVLARLALVAEFEVVNRARAVEGDGVEDAAAHRVDEDRD